jgi:hypothetical protein
VTNEFLDSLPDRQLRDLIDAMIESGFDSLKGTKEEAQKVLLDRVKNCEERLAVLKGEFFPEEEKEETDFSNYLKDQQARLTLLRW